MSPAPAPPGTEPLSGGIGAGASRRVLGLPGEPGAVSTARRWLTESLRAWPGPRVETARLLVSEVVTNAVLHARTDIEVRLWVEEGLARVEVADRHPSTPLPKHYRADAATGRGLRLLASLADRWGVARTATGKTVWFELGRQPGSTDPAPMRLGEAATDGDGSPGPPPPLVVEICIEDVPIDLYLASEQHNDAVMRELALVAQSANQALAARALTQQLLGLSEEVRLAFATVIPAIKSQVEGAIRRGSPTIDLRMAVPPSGWRALLRLVQQLDEADHYCEEGDLVTLVASPEVRRFRRWYARQVMSQMAGRPPEAWPGGGPAVQGPGATC